MAGSRLRHPPTGSSLRATSLRGDRLVSACQCEQISAGRGGCQAGRHPFAPEEPDPQEQPWQDRDQDREGDNRHREQYREPARRGVQVVHGVRDIECSMAGRCEGLADLVADQRNLLCAVARGREIARDAVRAGLDLVARLGECRDSVVNRQTDEHPERSSTRRRRNR